MALRMSLEEERQRQEKVLKLYLNLDFIVKLGQVLHEEEVEEKRGERTEAGQSHTEEMSQEIADMMLNNVGQGLHN